MAPLYSAILWHVRTGPKTKTLNFETKTDTKTTVFWSQHMVSRPLSSPMTVLF